MPNLSPGDYLLSGVTTVITGAAMDCRRGTNYGALFYQCSASGGGAGGSAVFNLEASWDTTAWMIDSVYTATATQSGSAQVNRFFPYMRGNVVTSYAGAGGTGQLWVVYHPGLK